MSRVCLTYIVDRYALALTPPPDNAFLAFAMMMMMQIPKGTDYGEAEDADMNKVRRASSRDRTWTWTWPLPLHNRQMPQTTCSERYISTHRVRLPPIHDCWCGGTQVKTRGEEKGGSSIPNHLYSQLVL